MRNYYLLFVCYLFAVPLLAQQPVLTVQKGHAAPVTSVATSEDGRLLASGSFDGTVRLWDILSKKELRAFRLQSMGQVEVAMKGEYLAGSGADGVLKIWNIETGAVLKDYLFAQKIVSKIRFQPNENALLVGFADGSAEYVDYENDKKSKAFKAHSDLVRSLDFSTDGKYFLTAAADGLKVWDTKKMTLIRQLNTTSVTDAHFSFDGSYLIAAGEDGLVKIFKTQDFSYINAFEGHEKRLIFADISRDNAVVTALDFEGKAIVWDAQTRDSLQAFEVGANLRAAVLHPDGRTLITGFRQNLKLWRTETGKHITDLSGLIEDWQTKYVNAVKFSLDSQQIVSVGDKTLRFWSENAGDKIRLANEVEQLALHPNGRDLATLENNGDIVLWDMVAKDTVRTFEGRSRHLYFAENGRLLLGYWGRELIIWQTSTGKMLDFVTIGEADIFKLAIHPDESTIAVCDMNGRVQLYDYRTGVFLAECERQKHQFFTLQFSTDGRQIIGGTEDGYLVIWDVSGGKFSMKVKAHGSMVSALYLDKDYFVSGDVQGEVRVWNSFLEPLGTFDGHTEMIKAIDKNGDFLVTCAADNTIRLWDFKQKNTLATFYAFGDEWAIVTPQGLFDASNNAMLKMHYVVGLEPLALSQLKERYFEPGLLAKLLRLSPDPIRDVSAFAAVPLYPLADLEWKDEKKAILKIRLQERNGGVGKVSLFINKKEIVEDLNPKRKREFEVDLSPYQRYLKGGSDDFFAVRTYNEAGWLSSSPVFIRYRATAAARGENTDGKIKIELQKPYNPKFFGLVVGTSDYRGEQLDLSYADKDAADMMTALRAVATPLFGAENVTMTLLSTAEMPFSSKENIEKAFAEIAAKAKPEDIFVLYLAGHGTTYGEQDAQFYYLTKDLASENISDAAVRKQFTISTAELTEWLKKIPAQKQVMMIDACSSGSLVDKVLLAARSLSSSQRRALDRMKDRTGIFILAGSAANKASYEASQFGQGLLTYSLLLGMNGFALRENQYVDVMQLFQFAADKVPEFAAYIGGVQRPVIATPSGSNSFDIGQRTADVSIPTVEIKPLFVRANFQETDRFDDVLDLADALNQRLTDISGQGKTASILFLDVPKYPNAYAVRGRYTVLGETVNLKINVFKGDTLFKTFELQGSTRTISAMIDELLKNLEF